MENLPNKKHKLLSKKEILNLNNSKNVLPKPMELKSVFSTKLLDKLNDTITMEGVYTFVYNLPDRHFHKFLITRSGIDFRLFFIDDETSPQSPDTHFFVDGYTSENGDFIIKNSYEKDLKTNVLAEAELTELQDHFEYIFPEIADQINFILDPSEPESNIPTARKPISTQIIDPGGKLTQTYRMPKEEFLQYIKTRNLSRKSKV
jgi:hypothetical protein